MIGYNYAHSVMQTLKTVLVVEFLTLDVCKYLSKVIRAPLIITITKERFLCKNVN